MARRNASGQIPARGGAVWTAAMGEHQIDGIANEGVRVSRMEAHVKAVTIEAQREELLGERLASVAAAGTTEGFHETVDLLEASLPFNCEHVEPQSWFDEREPMRGDVHHLLACESTCNSFRGNIPYVDFADFEEVERTGCGKRETARFEPGHGKGTVARASLYFLLRYPGLLTRAPREFDGDWLRVLLAWHATHPVTRYERHRNQAIFAAQGNRNPLIDHPERARHLSFRV